MGQGAISDVQISLTLSQSREKYAKETSHSILLATSLLHYLQNKWTDRRFGETRNL
jgi:hypothetical protein